MLGHVLHRVLAHVLHRVFDRVLKHPLGEVLNHALRAVRRTHIATTVTSAGEIPAIRLA